MERDLRVGEAPDAVSPDQLLLCVADYLPVAAIERVREAFSFAAEAHAGQFRRSGEAYIVHPLITALTLARLHLDATAIVAALLHDVPEDTDVSLERIGERFGPEVAKLVRGANRLARLVPPTNVSSLRSSNGGNEKESELWAANLRKMFLAMAEDARVVLIKLADRLHNMATLGSMPLASRLRMAQETLDIYAPLAGRMGILHIRRQLEDLAFQHLDPEKHAEVSTWLAAQRPSCEQHMAEAIRRLERELAKAAIQAEFSGRVKHLFGIYQKAKRRRVGFDEVFDVSAVRVIVPGIADCYRALGVVHGLWPPIPGQFDDYIAMPKENHYQSLHSAVVGPEGKPMEIQIRTAEMHQVAEFGVAAHWRYKEGGRRDAKLEQSVAWLRQIVDSHKELGAAPAEFVESLRGDILRDQLYVFSPKGQIVVLSQGATPVDFAYRIHSDVGHHCVAAMVNQRLVPLDHPLENGDIVEVITSSAARGPSRDWLNSNANFVKTSQARAKIRQWFRRQQREDNVRRGREQLDRELAKLGLADADCGAIAALFIYDKVEDFQLAIGCGEINSRDLVARLIPLASPSNGPQANAPASPGGIDPRALAPCCHPLPGEPIVGVAIRGKGVIIHRANCAEARAKVKKAQVAVDWEASAARMYPVAICVEALDRPGLLRDVADAVSRDHVNMTSVSVETRPDQTASISATLMIHDLSELNRILSRVEGLHGVSNVRREAS